MVQLLRLNFELGVHFVAMRRVLLQQADLSRQESDLVFGIHIKTRILGIENRDRGDFRRRRSAVFPHLLGRVAFAFAQIRDRHFGGRLRAFLENIAQQFLRREASAYLLRDPAVAAFSRAVVAVDEGDSVEGEPHFLIWREASQILDWAKRNKERARPLGRVPLQMFTRKRNVLTGFVGDSAGCDSHSAKHLRLVVGTKLEILR